MHTEASTPFVDLLAPGEEVRATMAGAGPPKANGARVWVQLALAQAAGGAQRLLVVVLVQAPHGGPWQPVVRHAGFTAGLRLARYPRTPSSPARLEIAGLPEPVVVRDIDDPAVFPYLEPFLAAWAGPVEGAGVVQQRAIEDASRPSGPDPKLMLAVVGGLLALVALCCGLSGLLTALRAL
ncbi:hypothetical protein L6R53_06100 [Myxococcota bacterium]|nr:hypothetical protein [Myxococcota bacterium]